jgi:hypothetical protein
MKHSGNFSDVFLYVVAHRFNDLDVAL